MNSVLMDDVEVGDECIVGAMTFIAANTKIPPRSLVVGNPGKIIKQVSDEMIEWKTKGTRLYQMLPADCHESLIECQPLYEMPAHRPKQESLYETWEKLKSEGS
jgi:phenylacetic acid degradation protein